MSSSSARQPVPPGQAESVEARRCLVVAPHPDDEVVGCGGLVLQLTAAGTVVEVLVLTDGSAAAGEGENPEAHARRRRAEAEAAAEVLGVSALRFLDLTDGQLRHRRERVAEGIAEALLRLRPDLLLVPSPREVSADHRAAFLALHDVLAPMREGDELYAATRELRILLYEVNHPLHPDLLVDISPQLDAIRRAWACHASQLELHPYLEATLGLARFRTLTLQSAARAANGRGTEEGSASPASPTTPVVAVEAYRRLSPQDFFTRSPAQLLRHLGAEIPRAEVEEGPSFSVVVRTRDRPELLAEALASLAESTYRRAEVVLVNDGGEPPRVPEDFPLPVVRVDLAANRGRAGAAQAGVDAASGDWVCFLDDDDLAAPEHLATLAGLARAAGVRVAYTDAAVSIHELDGEEGWREVERRLPYSRDFDPEVLLLDNYIPFNTLVIERSLFAQAGPFDPELPFFEDWDLLLRLAEITPFHHLPRVTCEYRHFRGGAHHVFGAAPRERSDFLTVKARVLAKHGEKLTPQRLARGIDRLRTELVELGEARDGARREAKRRGEEAAAARRRQHEIEERHHRLHGELVSLRADAARYREELQTHARELARLYGEEQRLTADLGRQAGVAEGQGEEIARLHAEIGRLTYLVEAMEGTRAWRFHQWWQGHRGRD